MFSPDVRWPSDSLKRCDSLVRALQMASNGVRPSRTFKAALPPLPHRLAVQSVVWVRRWRRVMTGSVPSSIRGRKAGR